MKITWIKIMGPLPKFFVTQPGKKMICVALQLKIGSLAHSS